MGRLVAWVAVTLDGYMEGPGGEGDLGWLMPHVPESLPENMALLAHETDTILLGRNTYQGFSQFWPTQTGAYADLMNHIPKIVGAGAGNVEVAPWGEYPAAQVVDHEVDPAIRHLKTSDGSAITVLASGGLVSSLLSSRLVDEIRMQVCPVILGSGKRYLRDLRVPVHLTLVDTKPYPNGSILLTYQPNNDATDTR